MQEKNKLDKATLIKIGKGAAIAGTGAAALFILSAVGALDLQNPMLAGFIAWFVPTAVNFVREWMKGG